MNILPINNTSPKFNGRLITTGMWTDNLLYHFQNNPEICKLASGKQDIVGDMLLKKAADSANHAKGEKLYKLKIKAIPHKMNMIDKIKYYLGMVPTVNVTNDYHRDISMDHLMQKRINAEKYAKELGLTNIAK